VPDATGLELIAQELRDAHPDSVIDTSFHRGRAELRIDPGQNKEVLTFLRAKGYSFWPACTASTTTRGAPPGLLYELLDMREVDRISVKRGSS